ncbi:MAG: hypothetical protein UDK36_11430 [Bacteroidaceae bacterium]|nr:hypothetical protein [Bacteroidaceae bacterium]
MIKDYPIRNRKILLHVRLRHYLDANDRNIILNQYPPDCRWCRNVR